MTEAELTNTIVEAARICGWRCTHFRPAQTKHGWRTPLQGDVGFPDLILARASKSLAPSQCVTRDALAPSHVLALELKAAGGRLGEGQAEWLQVLDRGLVTARLVYPDDLDGLLGLLARREAPAA